MKYPVVVFGVKDVSRLFVEYLCKNGCPVDLVVTIDADVTANSVVSGYGSMDGLTESCGVQVFRTDAYDLKSPAAEAFFRDNEFGIGISMNWSRLIPGWILGRFEAGVFGLHGSCGYLPFGQGRATLNWTLIYGLHRFVMHVFRLDAGVDSPNIYARQAFEVNEFDDIRTLQYKDLLVSEQLAMRLLGDYRAGHPIRTVMRENDVQTRYPGRKPEDGRLTMTAYTQEICHLVRAVTHPFPGAFAFVGEARVTIWRAQPFDGVLDFSAYRTGEVLAVPDGRPIVRTVDGSLLITEYEAERALVPGDVLT